MTNAERVASMAQEISDIAEFRKSGLRYEKHFNVKSLILFTFLMLLPVSIYILSK